MVEFKVIDDTGAKLFHVGVLPQQGLALLFCDHLQARGIRVISKTNLQGHYDIFTYDEGRVQESKIELFKFMQESNFDKYNQEAWQSGKSYKRNKEIITSFDFFTRIKLGSCTTIIELLCIACYILMFFDERSVVQALGLFKAESYGDALFYVHLITPVFLHFGFMHIAFNLVMYEAFSRKIEDLIGKFKYLVLIFLIAIVSNYLQYLFMSRFDVFGGISGVVYGLIAYSAMLSLNEHYQSKLNFPKGMLIVSFVFIAFGFFLNGIAALCHLGGALIGLLLGIVDMKVAKPTKK